MVVFMYKNEPQIFNFVRKNFFKYKCLDLQAAIIYIISDFWKVREAIQLTKQYLYYILRNYFSRKIILWSSIFWNRVYVYLYL